MRFFYAAFLLLTLQSSSFAQTELYELNVDSTAETGCTGPSMCLCPVQLLGPVSGLFDLEFTTTDVNFDVYSVQNLGMEYIRPDGSLVVITGDGSYRVDPVSGLHRLELNLVVDGVAQFFESIGTLPGGSAFPDELNIDVFHQINACQYDGLRLRALHIIGDPPLFVRGDCNNDGQFNIADAVFLLNALFGGTPTAFSCDDSCDGNDDEALNIADGVAFLNALFGIISVPLPPPSPDCGADPVGDALGCVQFDCP